MSATVPALLAEAKAANQRGDRSTAAARCRAAVAIDAACVPAHVYLCRALRETGEWAQAAAHAEAIVNAQPGAPGPLVDLGLCQQKSGDAAAAVRSFEEALAAAPANPRIRLFLGAALAEAGRRPEAAEQVSLAFEGEPQLGVPGGPGLPRELAECAEIGGKAMRSFLTAHHIEAVSGLDTPRIENAIWPQTHAGSVSYRESAQKPWVFYVPDLDCTPVFERTRLDWVDEIEAASDAIRSEFLAHADLVASHARPYVDQHAGLDPAWNDLKGTLEWSSVHLFKGGERQSAADAFPSTCAALEAVPLVRNAGTPQEVFFSILKAGAAIPPHFGLANTPLTVHLPLIVPRGDAGLRVGEAHLNWHEGKVIAFDDSFEHEAWNRTNEDRIVLIFEAWRPDLTVSERNAAETAFRARKDWLARRGRGQ